MVAFYPVEGCSSAFLNGSTLIVVRKISTIPKFLSILNSMAIQRTDASQPSVSLGNLPQLAVDLIITSLGLRRLGWIGTGDTVAPFAGMDEGTIVTGGMEGQNQIRQGGCPMLIADTAVYGKPGLPLTVVQQRSPTMKVSSISPITSCPALKLRPKRMNMCRCCVTLSKNPESLSP